MKPKYESPAVKSAKKVKRKYSKGFTLTSSQSLKTRRALTEVSQGDISVSKCAKKYVLSYSCLQRRISRGGNPDSRNGPLDEEETIVEYISQMAIRGMGLKQGDIQDLIQTC